MERISLLSVSEHFQLSGIGLVVMPDFSVPESWSNIEEKVSVETPNGQVELLARLQLTHFNIRDIAAPLDRRWRIVLCFPTASKEQVPLGSIISVSPRTKNALKTH